MKKKTSIVENSRPNRSRSQFEKLEERRLLSASGEVVPSTGEVLAYADSARGLHLLQRYWQSPAGRTLRKLVSISDSEQLFKTRTRSMVELALKPGVSVDRALREVRRASFIRFASPNFQYNNLKRDLTPNDPSYESQEHLTQINAPAAWDVTTGRSEMVVAVLDDGVQTTHEDLVDRIWTNPGEIAGDGIDNDNNGFIDDVNGWDFASGDANVNPAFNAQFNQTDAHGTLVAGYIGATLNNGKGIAGVAGGGVSIMPVRFYGTGTTVTSSKFIQSLAYAVNNGAKLINVSYSIEPFMSDPAFAATVDFVYGREALWINSAGNQGVVDIQRLGISGTLFVANVNSTDIKNTSSNWGFGIDLSAPGTSVLGAAPGDVYYRATGTSFSSAITTGAAALIWSANPTWTRDQVAARLLGTTTDIDNLNPSFAGLLGNGRLDVGRAVSEESMNGPRVRRVNGLGAAGGALTALPSSITIDLRGVLKASTLASSSFELRNAGADGLFNTTDDLLVPVTLQTNYRIGTNRVQLGLGAGTNGLYRLTVRDTITDPFDSALDGDNNGTPGGNFVREFGVNVAVSLPAAPTTLDATVLNESRVDLTWLDVATDELSYRLERATSSNFGTGLKTIVLPADATSFSDTTVAAETTYYYRLQAVNNVGSSAFSNTSIATTPVSVIPVAPSMLVAVSRARDQISFSWRDNSSIEIRFLIERSRDADFATIDGTRTTGANETSFWDWGLSAGTTYYYRVRAESAAFVSPWSNVASATTSGTAPSGLNPPSALEGQSRGRTQISLGWEDNSALETGFRIERSTTEDFSADVFLREAPANATLFWDWGLSAGTTYYYRVSAIGATSVSTASNVVSIRTDGTTTPLGAPSLIVATPLESGEITLAWQDNAGSETRFRIERSRSETFASGIVVREAMASSELFWDWDLLPGTRYYYRMRAENAGGVGDWSETVNALTAGDLNVPPAAPTGLTVRQQAADVILNWIDNANNENGFLIQRSTTSDFSSGVVTRQSGASGGVFWDWDLISGTTYFYRVRAFNDAGNSAFSNVVSINYTV